jgi:hypothetical protein
MSKIGPENCCRYCKIEPMKTIESFLQLDSGNRRVGEFWK